MDVRNDGKRTDADDRLERLLAAVPDTDQSVSPRAIAEAYRAARNQPLFVPSAILESARAITTRNRQRLAVEAEGDRDHADEAPRSTLKARRSEAEALLSRRTKALVRDLGPWLAEWRIALFGTAAPPFGSLAAAAEWIEQHTEPWKPESPAVLQQDTALGAVYDQLYGPEHWIYGVAVGVKVATKHNNNILYWRPDGDLGVRDVSRDQRQAFGVYTAGLSIAKQTTLPSASAIALLLTDIRPGQQMRLSNGRPAIMPGLKLFTWRVHTTMGIFVKPERLTPAVRVTLDLDARDLTDRNLRVARRAAMRSLPLEAPRHLTAKQQRALQVVDALGGPPTPRYALTFWTRAAKRLRMSNPIVVAKLYYRAAETRVPTKGPHVTNK